MRLTLWALLLLLTATRAFGLDPSRLISQYGHMMWTLQDGGLPGTPTAMTQTADGYLWIGTRNGLVRFDGVRFVPFAASNGDGLRSKRVLALYGSRDGSLWIGTRMGLHRWHQGRLVHYADSVASINAILEDTANRIWFTRSSLRAEDKNGTLCEVSGDQSKCHHVATRLSKDLKTDGQGGLWTVSDAELVQWRNGAGRTWLPEGLADSALVDVVQSVAPAPDGTVWVGAMQPSRGLGLLRLENGRLRPFVSPALDGRTLSVGSMRFDKDGALWFGTQNEGVYRLHNGSVSRFRRSDGLSSDTIQYVYEDREGTIWVVTTQGIDAFRDLSVASVSSREGLSADLANAVLVARDGTVWINAWHSLDSWRDGRMTTLSARNGLPGEEVTVMYQDRSETLWIGVDRDLTVFENGVFNRIRAPDGTPLGSMTSIAQDAQGDIWTINHSPPTLTRIRDRKVVERIGRSAVPFTFGVMAADPEEGIWFPLTSGNIGRFRSGKLEIVEMEGDPQSIPSGIVALPDRSVLASTARGLMGWREGKLQWMNSDNGLPCDDLYTMLKDSNSSLWLYASCGVMFIASDQLEAWWKNPQAAVGVRLFDALEGAQPARGNYFPKGSIGPDGRVWFANASVVQMIDPRRFAGNTIAPPVHVEQLIADRTSFPLQELTKLPPKPREIQIDYTGLSMVVPQKTRFRYRLLGHDDAWEDVGTRRQAFYTDLPPGDYVFEVTASNNDGLWNPTPARARFTIAPTFYETRAFTVLCIMVALGMAWLLLRLRDRQVETRMRARIEARLAERERIARELHDTLLQGVMSASLQLSVANSQLPRESPAKSLVEKILLLLRQVSDEGRSAVRDLRERDPSRDSIERALAHIPKDLAVDDQAQYRLIVEGTPDVLHPLIRDEVERIAREGLANAFRHSGASTVEAVLEYTADHFRLVVRDNGRGIDPDILQSGRAGHWGLSGMRERASRIGAQLRVLSRRDAGTEVELTVPATVAFEARMPRRWTRWLNRLYLRSDRP